MKNSSSLSGKDLFSLFAIWLILALALLLTCDVPKEIDFERYMSISQYIFTHKEYLLLHFQGAIYTDKPPLMFWLIAGGWHLFGVHVWWPYLMLCFFSGASVFMTYHIAKILYENDENPIEKAFRSALFLLTLTFFGMAVCELRVDTLLLFFVLLIHYGCLKLSKLSKNVPDQSHFATCFIIFSGVALGLYTKGPLIFVVGLLPALVGLWAAKQKIYWKSIVLSVLPGILPILFWLIPACIQGGEAYTHDVLFGQIANRSVRQGDSVFFYLLRFPGYLFPFILFPSVWLELYKACFFWKPAFKTLHPAVYYSLSGIFILTIIFSLFGQKAMHYLLPTMPLWAIFLANAVKFGQSEVKVFKVFLIIFAFFGVFMLFWQTGIGLQLLRHATQYAYNFYLTTQSFQFWQLIVFAVFSIISLVFLYKHFNALLPIVVLLSIILQINIQILNQYYFQARFYTYFHEKIVEIQQKKKTINVFLSEKDNQIYCSSLLPANVAALHSKHPDYVISNQRCLFFNARHWHADPETIFVPRIFCAFGLWEMNENTQKLLKACEE